MMTKHNQRLHSDHYGAQTLATLQAERLEGWVDLRIGDLDAWEDEHLNPERALGLDFSLPEG